MINKKILFALFIILFSLTVSAYTVSNVQYTQTSESQSVESTCVDGQDFLIQITPFGCTPSVVRSDLLEENDVQVYCQLGATKINPLITVESIDSISISGDFSDEVSGIGFHPAKAALGLEDLSSSVLSNIGYVVINLKKQPNSSAIPDYVSGTLTANIKYDIDNALGIGDALFYLPEISDEDWDLRKNQYSFWSGKGYLRADDIGPDSVSLSVYSGDDKISNVVLQEGKTSNNIYIPGFECNAGLTLKLESLENPDTYAKLRINSEVVEVTKGQKFLDNKCEVRDLSKRGIVETVTISCKEDEETTTTSLIISPKIVLNINGEDKDVGLGDYLYNDGDKRIYLGYIGSIGSSSKYLYVFLYSTPTAQGAQLSDEEISSIDSLVKDLSTAGVSSTQLIDQIEAALNVYAGAANLLYKALARGESFYRINFNDKNQNAFGQTVSIVGFSGVQDSEISESVKEQYESAKQDYESIRQQFSSQSYDGTTFGEEALYNEIVLAWDANQKRVVSELCDEFLQDYPNSDKNLEYCKDSLKISNSDTAEIYVTINGKLKKISLDGIYEPSFEEYGVRVMVTTPEGTKNFDLRKNSVYPLQTSGSSYIKLISAADNSSTFKISVSSDTGTKTEVVNLEKGITKDFVTGYSFTLTKINLKKLAKVSLTSNINNEETKANFSFKIGIEKRAINLSPDQIKQLIEGIDASIAQWTSISESLGTVIGTLKASCLATGAVLIAKNFLLNAGGSGTARQSVMRGKGGWVEICTTLVSKGTYSSLDECYLENSDKIDADVEKLSSLIDEQNSQIKKLESGITTQQFLTDKVVNTTAFMEKYSSQVNSYLESNNIDSALVDSSGKGETLSKDKILSVLTIEGYSNRFYTTEQLREIELYSQVLNDASASNELKNLAQETLYSTLSDISTAAKDFDKISKLANSLNIASDKITSLETGKNVKKLAYEGLLNKDLGSRKISGVDDNTPIALIQTFPDGMQYILVLDDSLGTSKLPVKKINNILQIYDYSSGSLVKNPSQDLVNIYFERYDSSSYKNKYLNAELSYYETEPYKGLPAIVPFDLTNGWYAGIKQTLSTSALQSYEASGRVSSFYLCNVGKNGLEEFQTVGDDICELINTGTGQAYDQFPGLSEKEAKNLINTAVKSIEQASKLYKSGLSGTVTINGQKVKVGSPAVDVPEYTCQDFMSPKECLLLFNLCDPVICPSSRCDLGGAYPVKNVVQSGVIGSLVLCLPNIKEGIVMPVCLTGVKAGIDSFLSIEKAYRDCLNESLESGETVGICDEVYSIYLCDFFWRQAIPFANLAIPKIIEFLSGQNVRGGGEYMTVSNAWSGAESAINYFVNYYGVNSKTAFLARSSENISNEICKLYASAVYPSAADLLSTLTEADSPVQFTGRFDEIPLTTTTVPPTSQYKVYYHIYAGEDSGAYYQVYLKGTPESSYYQDTAQTVVVDSGYIAVGGYADETKDLTAASGYKQLCISVNGEEECGFASVSTSFAVNYVKDAYLASQASKTDIKTTSECIADYSNGIIRICATDNPGQGTDAYVGTNESRWQDVGYCDNEEIRCWIDTESIETAITTTSIEGETLTEVSENYVEKLANESGYLTEDQFSSALQEINDANASTKITLINNIYDKIFWTDEKAQLLFLRGNAYAEIFRILWSKLPKPEALETTEEETTTVETSEQTSTIEGISDITDARERVLTVAEQLEGTVVLGDEGTLVSGKINSNCWTAAQYVYQLAGIVFSCAYADEQGLEYSNIPVRDSSGNTIGRTKISIGGTIFGTASSPGQQCTLNMEISSVSSQDKLDNLKSGDLISYVWDSKSGHNAVFIEWVDESNRIARLFDWNGNRIFENQESPTGETCTSDNFYPYWKQYSSQPYCKVYRYFTEDLSDTGGHPVWIYWQPYLSVSSAEESSLNIIPESVKQEELTITTGEIIYQEAFKMRDSNKDAVEFVIQSLINADITGIDSKISSISSLISALSTSFAEIETSDLKVGDIILLGKGCNKDYSVGIVHSVSDKIYFYTNLEGSDGKVQLEGTSITSEISDDVYIYGAYRFTGDLSDSDNAIEIRDKWTIDTALDEIATGLTGDYDHNKVFFDELIFDGILTEEECDEIGRNNFLGWGQKDIPWLKDLLLEKKASVGQEESTIVD